MAYRILCVFKYLPEESHPIFQAATIFICTMIEATRKEVHKQGKAVPSVHINEVELRLLGTQRSLTVPLPKVTDIGFIHRPCLYRSIGVDGDCTGRNRWNPAIIVGVGIAAMHQLDSGQRPMLMYGLCHFSQCRNVSIVPQPSLCCRAVVRVGMDFHLFRADHSPSTFGLDSTHRRQRVGAHIAHAVAMWNLIKAILRGYRPNLYRFKKNVVTRITLVHLVLSLPQSFLTQLICSKDDTFFQDVEHFIDLFHSYNQRG